MRKRLKHLYDLYEQEPTDLTDDELLELMDAGIIEWHPCGDCELNHIEYSFDMEGVTYD